LADKQPHKSHELDCIGDLPLTVGYCLCCRQVVVCCSKYDVNVICLQEMVVYKGGSGKKPAAKAPPKAAARDDDDDDDEDDEEDEEEDDESD
jgi:hypothetical protein